MTLETCLKNARRAAEGQFPKHMPRRRDMIQAVVDTAERQWRKEQREWQAANPVAVAPDVAKPASPIQTVVVAPRRIDTIRERFENKLRMQMADGRVSQTIGKAQLDGLKCREAQVFSTRRQPEPHLVWLDIRAKNHFEGLLAKETPKTAPVTSASMPKVEPVIVASAVVEPVSPKAAELTETVKRRSVDELAISPLALGAMRQGGITTLGALIQRTEAEMLSLPNFGRKSLKEVKAALWGMNLAFVLKETQAKKALRSSPFASSETSAAVH